MRGARRQHPAAQDHFVASPGEVMRRHRPADVWKTRPDMLCAALADAAARSRLHRGRDRDGDREATSPRGCVTLHLVAECRHARGGGLAGMAAFAPDLNARLAAMLADDLHGQTVGGGGGGGGGEGVGSSSPSARPAATPLGVMREAMSQRGWDAVAVAGGDGLAAALASEAVAAVRAAPLAELARCCGDPPLESGAVRGGGGEVHAAAAGRVAGDAAACAGVCQLARDAGGKTNLAALLHRHLLDPADVASLLAREAAGGAAGLEETLACAGAEVLDAALRLGSGSGSGSGSGGGGGGASGGGGGEGGASAAGASAATHTAREALSSLLCTDLTRAAARGGAGAEAYEALLRGHALGYAARHGGFGGSGECSGGGGGGGGGMHGHEALAAVLTSLARSKARLEEVDKRHARAAEAAAKRTAEVRARLARLEHDVRAAELLRFGAEEDDEVRAAAAAGARRVASAREELVDAEAAESRTAQEAEADKALLIAAMRSQFRLEWSPLTAPARSPAPSASPAAPSPAPPPAAAAASAARNADSAGASSAAGGEEAGAPDVSATCKVCLDRPLEVLLMPCRHVSLCRQCAADVRLTRCPVCRGNIRSKERVFVS